MPVSTEKRVTARAYCSHCAWSAQHTGDDALEVGTFLRDQILTHADKAHPDKRPPTVVLSVSEPAKEGQ